MPTKTTPSQVLEAKLVATPPAVPKGWVLARDAERLTGRSFKHLQRLARQGVLEKQYQQVPGRRDEVLYREADLAAILPGVLRPAAPPLLEMKSTTKQLARQAAPAPEPLALPAPTSLRVEKTPFPWYQKTFLTLDEARVFTGLPASYLRSLRNEGPGKWVGKRFYFRRDDLLQL